VIISSNIIEVIFELGFDERVDVVGIIFDNVDVDCSFILNACAKIVSSIIEVLFILGFDERVDVG